MTTESQHQDVTVARAIHQITVECALSENRQEFIYRILNRCIACQHYDRAILWDVGKSSPNVLGVSGLEMITPSGPQVELWQTIATGLPSITEPTLLTTVMTKQSEAAWQALTAQAAKLQVLLVPIPEPKKKNLLLWFERWDSPTWTSQEMATAEVLARSIGALWRHFTPGTEKTLGRVMRQKKIGIAVIATLLIISCFVPVRLRVVAPCDVVPDTPYLVTAPLEGVIATIPVQPGQMVKEGDLLVQYEEDNLNDKVRVLEESVRIAEAVLKQAKLQSFSNDRSKGDIPILEHRLLQEQARLNLLQRQSQHLQVRAPRAGMVLFKSAEDWRGRPTRQGERIMVLADEGKTKLKIWLPESDHISFDRAVPVRLIMKSTPASTLHARLLYVASAASATPTGMSGFEAEAEWADTQQKGNLPIGASGTAILYGRRIPFAAWLLRKPWAGLREFVGY